MTSTSSAGAAIDKGKGRATSVPPTTTERTPLLESHLDDIHDPSEVSVHDRRRLYSKLTFVFLITLSISVVLFVLLTLLAYSYASRISALPPKSLLERTVVFGGLDRVDLLNVTEGRGIWLEIEGRVGLDVGAVMDLNSDGGDGFWRGTWKAIGRWGVRKLDQVSIDIGTACLSSKIEGTLVAVDVPPLQLPLTTNPPPNDSWLTHVSTPLFVHPSQNATALTEFLRSAWIRGVVEMDVTVRQAEVRGGGLGDHSWRRNFGVVRSDIKATIQATIPSFPGLPTPGPNSPFPDMSQLITLQSYAVSLKSERLVVQGEATAINPFPESFALTTPKLPFVVSVPSIDSPFKLIPVVSVYNQAFALTRPNISISVSGTFLPIPASLSATISTMLSRYLTSKPNNIDISTPLFPGLAVHTVVPGPHPRPQILRNVTIRNMRIQPSSGGVFTASGTVYALVVLPKGVDVELEVRRVFPDVLVFDGEVPDDVETWTDQSDEDVPAPHPLPEPLPSHAFARIRPDEWLPSKSTPLPQDEVHGSIYAITADVVDVPLEVLPGRNGDFRRFVTKVVFGTNGALAGLLGHGAVALDVNGLDFGNEREIELMGLPFRGSVRIGKKRGWGI